MGSWIFAVRCFDETSHFLYGSNHIVTFKINLLISFPLNNSHIITYSSSPKYTAISIARCYQGKPWMLWYVFRVSLRIMQLMLVKCHLVRVAVYACGVFESVKMCRYYVCKCLLWRNANFCPIIIHCFILFEKLFYTVKFYDFHSCHLLE